MAETSSNGGAPRPAGSAMDMLLSDNGVGGHIAAMVNPPGNEKASFRIAKRNPKDPEAWLSSASEQKGTWWDDWIEWLRKRSAEWSTSSTRLSIALRSDAIAPGGYGVGQSKVITLRMPSWASMSSKPRFTSSSLSSWEISGATSISPCR